MFIEHPALGELSFGSHVTCLAVHGNRAGSHTGTVAVSTDPDIAVGSEFQIEMTDNGSPGLVRIPPSATSASCLARAARFPSALSPRSPLSTETSS
jgi:hypothetical protein